MRPVIITGQLVSYEVVDASASSCPVELIKVQVPDNDSEFLHVDNSSSAAGRHQRQAAVFPFVRSVYDARTGNAPNRPRQPVLFITRDS